MLFSCINVCQVPREMLLHKVNALGNYLALYFVTVWSSASECTFFKYINSRSERIKRFKMAVIIRFDLDISKMTVQGGCCTTVVVQNEIQIHQQKRRKAYSYMP